MENVQDMSGCSIDQKVKYTAGSFVGKALTWWNSHIRTLSWEVVVIMSWNDFQLMMIQESCSHEMQKLESELWNHAMVGAGHAAYTDRFHELARLVMHLVTPESRMIERYVYGLAPQIHGMVAATKPTTVQKAVQIFGALADEAVRNGSIKKVEKRGNVGEPNKDRSGRDDNKRTRSGNFNEPSIALLLEQRSSSSPLVLSRCEEARRGQGRGNQRNQLAVGRPCIEPSDLGFRYEIEIASGQLVEIDKVIKGCKLEIEGHFFDIDLIPFGHKSFDVIIGMGWLSNYKAEIIFHEKVVRIPLTDGNMLRVLRERPEEKAIFFMGVKKQEEIVVVRAFLEVFPDDLSGLLPIREIKFRIELIPEATLVAKSPYRLAPSELEELEVQFLGDVINGNEIHVDPSEIKAKSKTFKWGEEQELAFQTLKDKLCNAPVLALLDGPKDFVLYCDASGIGLGCVLMQRELFSDYDCEIRYHPGKANVVADSLIRKERVKPKRVRAMNMILQSSIKDRILAAQKEVVDEFARLQRGADKMYYDLRDRYWWPGMKKDIAEYEGIAIDFVTKLPRTSSGHDIIWVIVDRLTKFAYFLPMREDYKMDRLARLYLNEISMQEVLGTRLDMSTAYHPQTDGQSERTIQTLEDMLRVCVLDFKGSWDVYLPLVEFSYNNSYHSSVRCAPFEALYGRKCRSPIIWAEVGEGQLIGPELVQEPTEKISQIKDRPKVTRDRQKSYADKRMKPLEFGVGDYILLKVSPWKSVVHFGKKRKLAPRFVGPLEIIEKVGPMAYRLDLHEELNGVHDTFHVSNLKKCLADLTL
uniref:Reverse transcriptase domain-containing protein n=1 Tax=Tanacetum cinerariifolium TaxID=118510 RepID=A0A6L2JQZ8_TANCI|nr:reverse transcriptase domain-containing protein [Tanacetum cinerariifolium]